MDEVTIERLNALNREFYRHRAASFDQTRRAPWPGWERVATLLPESERPSILDVGCGNGRFGLFLERTLGRPVDYLGVDASAELLALAARRAPRAWRFVEADLVAGDPFRMPAGRFDLVAGFGLLHHVPGEATRRRLLEEMADRVAEGGHLAVSFWQFGERRRFTARARGFECLGLAGGDVEPNDFLLPWGEVDRGTGDPESPLSLRYCHFVAPAEAKRLTAGLGLTVVEELRSDGDSEDLNLYVLLRREVARPARTRGSSGHRSGQGRPRLV